MDSFIGLVWFLQAFSIATAIPIIVAVFSIYFIWDRFFSMRSKIERAWNDGLSDIRIDCYDIDDYAPKTCRCEYGDDDFEKRFGVKFEHIALPVFALLSSFPVMLMFNAFFIQ